MKQSVPILLLALWLWAGGAPPCLAQLDDHVRHHVILSIDSRTFGRTQHAYLADWAIQALFGKDSLLRKGDLLSIVTYAASSSDPSLQRFVTKAQTEEGREFVYYPVDDVAEVKSLLRRHWTELATSSDSGTSYSLSSVAKPYSLAALPYTGEYTNRTFVILVTDHQYNGNDFYQEITFWKSEAGSWMDKDAIMQKCYSVENEFFLAYLRTEQSGSICFDIYEYRPLQASLSLSSVLYYPPSCQAVRVKGNRYQVVLETSPQPGDHYEVKRLDVTPRFEDGSVGTPLSVKDRGHVRDTLYFEREKAITSLEVRAWVLLKDGFCNSVILTPSPDAPDYLGREGLNVSISVDKAVEAEVFGFRLPEALWLLCPDDPFKCAFLWEVILVVFGLLALGALLISWKTYRPKKGRIHLR